MKVKKIVLEVKGKEVSVSIDEAKELRTVLNELFEKEIHYLPGPVIREHTPYNPNPFWYGHTHTTNGTELTSIN